MIRHTIAALATIATSTLLAATAPQDAKPVDLKSLTGTVKVDGSSTVFPIAEAVHEEFNNAAPNVKVMVSTSGTGGGFKRFCAGEIDISDASRPIKKSEADQAVANKVEYVELPIAYDGLTICVNRANTWCTQLTVEQIKKIFSATNTAKTWKDVDPSWPAENIKIYSPGTDSGTFDYFKEVVVGKDGNVRADMSVSEDDNQLVRGIEGDKNAIGFFGYAYYAENKGKLNDVKVVNPKSNKPVEPTPTTIEDGSYAPFSRPLFIYVSKAALAKPQVAAFAEYFLKHAPEMAKEVGYVPLPKAINERALANLKAQKTGSQFMDDKGHTKEGALADLYR